MGASITDQIVTRFLGDSSSLENASKRAGDSLRHVADTSKGALHSLKETFGRRSEFGEAIELLHGAGAIAGLGLLAHTVEHVTAKLAESSKEAKGFGDRLADTVKALPIIGSFAEAGENLHEAFHRTKSTLEAINGVLERTNKLVDENTLFRRGFFGRGGLEGELDKVRDQFVDKNAGILGEISSLTKTVENQNLEVAVRDRAYDQIIKLREQLKLNLEAENKAIADIQNRGFMDEFAAQVEYDAKIAAEKQAALDKQFEIVQRGNEALDRERESEFDRLQSIADKFTEATKTAVDRARDEVADARELLSRGVIDDSEFNRFVRRKARGLAGGGNFNPVFPTAALLGSQEDIAAQARDDATRKAEEQTADNTRRMIQLLTNVERAIKADRSIVYGIPP